MREAILIRVVIEKEDVSLLTVFNRFRVNIACLLRLKSFEKRLDNDIQLPLTELSENRVLEAYLIRLNDDIKRHISELATSVILQDHLCVADILDLYLILTFRL